MKNVKCSKLGANTYIEILYTSVLCARSPFFSGGKLHTSLKAFYEGTGKQTDRQRDKQTNKQTNNQENAIPGAEEVNLYSAVDSPCEMIVEQDADLHGVPQEVATVVDTHKPARSALDIAKVFQVRLGKAIKRPAASNATIQHSTKRAGKPVPKKSSKPGSKKQKTPKDTNNIPMPPSGAQKPLHTDGGVTIYTSAQTHAWRVKLAQGSRFDKKFVWKNEGREATWANISEYIKTAGLPPY